MNEALALKLLRQIMGWNEETAVEEYRWVRLMASFKYDGYRDYLAGARFPETLAGWLMQFKAEDRAAAYAFVKSKLLYFSPLEIVRLVDQFYPRFIERKLRAAAAAKFDIPPYLVMTRESFRTEFFREQRRTLFIGLSDGARLDMLRRANAGVLVNCQSALKFGSDSISMKFADGIALFSKENQRHANQFSDFCPRPRGSDCRKRDPTRRFHPCNRSVRYPGGELSSVWIAFATRSQQVCS